jgi:MFS transporter, UMF1 family
VSDLTPSPPPKGDKRAIWSWATYDWANSAYTTLIVTFIYSAFFTQGIAEDGITGTVQWANAIIITAITVALLSPFLGAVADQGGHRKLFLVASTVITIASTALLYIPTEGQVVFALTIFVISNIAFEMCNVFYNSYLPELTEREWLGRVSGYGWALGYAGGFVAMGIALAGFVADEPWFGLSTEGAQNVRATTLLVAAWFGLFSIPMFLWVRDPPGPTRRPIGEVLRGAGRQLADTVREVRRYGQIVRLLLARMFYNDGLVTIFAFGSIYATETFGFSLQEVILWGLALNVSAGLGAFAMGFLDDRIGGKKTIGLSILGLSAGAIWASMAGSKASLWAAGIVIGAFVGPNQSASRSLLGRFVPHSKETEFFGFFAFSGKAIAFMGPWVLARMVTVTGNQRWGVASVLAFFLIGGLLLLSVNEEKGFAAAQNG